jgi:hypothetical protein
VQVVLFAAMVEFQGDTVESIRIKAPAVKKAAAPRRPEPDPVADIDEESIPF